MWFALVCVALLGYLLYFYLVSEGKPPAYWKKYGIPQIDASGVASSLDILLFRKQIKERDAYAYKQLGSRKFCGMLENPKPVILIKDVELVKKVFIKNFDHFVDRRDFIPIREGTILHKMFARGDEWKATRASMTPTFTTGRIRRMMGIFNASGKEFTDMLKSKAESSPSGSATIPILSAFNQFALEVIGSTIFGLNTGTIKNPDSIFAKNAALLTNFSVMDIIKISLGPRYPKLFNTLGIDVMDEKAINFFADVATQSLSARKNGTVKRNDFQQILLEAQKGELKELASHEMDQFDAEAQLKNVKGAYISDDTIVAMSVGFFLAGFQTIATFLTFIVYTLAVHQDIQDKLRKAIDGAVKEDGTVDYDEVNEIPYLDMVCNEVMRKYPPALRLERDCNKDFYDSETGLFVPKDGVVVLPVYEIHHDPAHYDNPDKFDPEHFSPENKAKRSPYAYLPFGHGPRSCIGIRFALIESKTAIAHLLHNFRIEPATTTPIPLQTVTAGIQMLTPPNLELKLTPLKNKN